jgi:hypothetical protein
MRKFVGTSVNPPTHTVLNRIRGLPIHELATVLVTSEAPDHPVEHLFDGQHGIDASKWVASDPGEQTIILAFDTATPTACSRDKRIQHASNAAIGRLDFN